MFKIYYFCIWTSFRKIIFFIRSLVFEKYGFWFKVLYLSKFILELIIKNKYISSIICIGSFSCTIYFKYLVFVFEQVLKKFRFHLERLVLKNIGFDLSFKFIASKIVQIVCNMCWFLITHICTSNIYMNLFLWSLWSFMRIYRYFKSPIFQSYNTCFWAVVGRPTSRPKQGLVDRAIDRRAQKHAWAHALGSVDHR